MIFTPSVMDEPGSIMEESKKLERTIEIEGGKIALKTRTIDGLSHSFYLTHAQNTEKVLDAASTSFLSDVSAVPGLYAATFLYEKGHEKTIIRNDFIINKSNKIELLQIDNIADEENYRIDQYDIGSDTTFIVFNATNTDKTSPIFGLKFLLTSGYNVIACRQNKDQFQGLSFENFSKHVKPLVQGKTVFTYGNSLGAYAALYYAGAVNANVISSAPRNSSHPAYMKMRGRKASSAPHKFVHREMTENPTTSGDVFIFIDPHNKLDMFTLEHIVSPAYPRHTLVECEHAGHQVLYHINRTGQLPGLLKNIVEGNHSALALDENLHSRFTDMGKTRHLIRKKQYDKAKLHAQRVLESPRLPRNRRRAAEQLLTRIDELKSQA